jgi:PLP dependent protein
VNGIAERLAAVRERIDAATRAAGREPRSVDLVAVSKTVAAPALLAAIDAGQLQFGENRAQELVDKASELGRHVPAPVWHFVGRLQRNKVRVLAPRVAQWHSIDRSALVDELARVAPGVRVFVQVDLAGEPQKGGCAPGEAAELVDRSRAHGLAVVGLMTVPPLAVDPRPHFAELRTLAERLDLVGLSMGMTADYEVAIAEGATCVRVGSAIFGARREAGPLRR